MSIRLSIFYDILKLMIVSNNSILNILLPNDNKVLKEVLKEADSKTLDNLKNSSKNVSDILKNLFSDLKTGNKSNASIENILKNSNLFKDLGNFTNSLKTLLDNVKNDPSLAKFKPALENLLKDISTLDEKSLKEMITKSGVFQEAKVLNSLETKGALPKNLEQVLNQIKTIIKDMPSIEAKNIETLIDKIIQNNKNPNQTSNLQNSSDLKFLVKLLQDLSKNIPDKQVANLTNLTNQLKSITLDAQLVESKLENTNNQTQNIQKTNENAKLSNIKNEVVTQTRETLTQLKNELLNNPNIKNSQTLIKQIDNLLINNNLFSKNTDQVEPKALLNQLVNLSEIKTAENGNSNLSNIVNNLKNLSEDIANLEAKTLSNKPVVNEKLELTQNLKESLTNLKNELATMKNIDSKIANQIIDKLLNIQNLFSKIELPMDLKNLQQAIQNQGTNLNNFQNLFSSNIDNLILNLKESIINSANNPNTLNLQQNIVKTIEKLENILNNLPLDINNKLDAKQTAQNNVQNDMKTLLLQMQEELSSKADPKSTELLKHVDKMVTHLEYYQLLGLSTNSNSVYIPFFWDMLEEGDISMKKLSEDRFYCEINLNLKEFGQTQLLLSIYDKNKIDLTIHASKESFKQAIRENFSKLRVALNNADLIPVNIKIVDLKKDKEISVQEKQQAVFNQDDLDLGFGVNIKA